MGQGVLTSATVWARRQGVLHCEDVSLEQLAHLAGTPCYVYSAGMIRAQYARLQQALGDTPHRIHYACKANGNLAILRLLREMGCHVDVVSGGELFRAQEAGFQPDEVIFGGVGKSAAELTEAIAAGVSVISVESAEELGLIDQLAAAQGVVARVGIRINPEVTVDTTHAYIKTGEKGNKFGVPYDDAAAVARQAARMSHVRLVAVGMHLGSQLTALSPYAAGLDRLRALIVQLRADGVETIEYLDIGGGLFVPYADEAPADLDAWVAIVAPVAQALELELIIEPGRFLVAEAGALLARVLYRKRSGGREMLVIDAGMTDLLRPSHYDAFHRIESVRPAEEQGVFDVVGPICESGDFLALNRPMDAVGPGALLCVHTAGAYGYAMSFNYNARPRAAEVLVDGDRWAVVTARESYRDLVARELQTPEWRTAS